MKILPLALSVSVFLFTAQDFRTAKFRRLLYSPFMDGDKDSAAYRAELSRQQPAPEIYAACAFVDGSPPVWPGSIVVKKPDEARRSVDEIKFSGADFIKVYTRVPRDAYFALAEEARKQNIPFAGHVPDAVTAQEGSSAGQRSMEHLQGIGISCSSKQDSLMGALNRAEFFRDRLFGKLANLVLLRSDPLANIHNTTQIQAVWLNGKYFDQTALSQLLESAKRAANHSFIGRVDLPHSRRKSC